MAFVWVAKPPASSLLVLVSKCLRHVNTSSRMVWQMRVIPTSRE